MRGRPSKFQPELGQRIVDVVRVTGMAEAAAAACGIHRATLYRWLERGGKQRSGPLRDFADAVTKAQGESETRLLTLITKSASAGEWRAAAWLLERRNPELYGPRIQLTLRQALEGIADHVAAHAPDVSEGFLRLFAGEDAPSTAIQSGVVILPREHWEDGETSAATTALEETVK
jgi:hypothetical protein